MTDDKRASWSESLDQSIGSAARKLIMGGALTVVLLAGGTLLRGVVFEAQAGGRLDRIEVSINELEVAARHHRESDHTALGADVRQVLLKLERASVAIEGLRADLQEMRAEQRAAAAPRRR